LYTKPFARFSLAVRFPRCASYERRAFNVPSVISQRTRDTGCAYVEVKRPVGLRAVAHVDDGAALVKLGVVLRAS
jgi:hypothetical protein